MRFLEQRIWQSTRLCSGNFDSRGVKIGADNIELDCNTAVIRGRFHSAGIVIQNRQNVTLKNCQIANYEAGILIINSYNVTILKPNLIHNYAGVKIVNSTGVVVEAGFDISTRRPVHAIRSVGNVFAYTNKKIKGDECRLNQCNTPSGIAAHDHKLMKDALPKKALTRVLNDNLRAWI
jgi:hypothetical protein